MNVTDKQKRILLDYMKANEDFARGRLRYNSGNKKILDDMWTSITISLNATGNGPQKQAKEWQKTWRDWKSNVLKKCAQNKSYAGGTGGGPPKVLPLTELEESLLEIIDVEATGLADIPEGGNFNRTMQRGSVPTNDTIQERESFDMYRGSCKRIVQEVGLKEQHLSNSMQMKRFKKCTSTLASNKMYEMNDNSLSTSTSGVLYNTDFSTREENNINHFDHNVFESDVEEIVDDIVLENKNTIIAPRRQVISEFHQAQSNATKLPSSKENKSNAAVRLMRDNIEMKQEMVRISNEKLLLQREKFDFLKSVHSNYKDILSNIDYNVMRLREEVEKMVPSYLV